MKLLPVPQIYTNMRAQEGVADAEKLGWTSTELQQQNFDLIVGMLKDAHVVLPGLSLHDAGCGTGDLLTYLKRVGLEPRQYVGTDFSAEVLDIARTQHPGAEFLQVDLHLNQQVLTGTGRQLFFDTPGEVQEALARRAERRGDVYRIPKTDVTIVMGSLAFHRPRVVEKILSNLWDNTDCALAFNTWWELPKNYLYHEHITQLRRCINRFLRGKQWHRKLGQDYGQPTEALFVVYR